MVPGKKAKGIAGYCHTDREGQGNTARLVYQWARCFLHIHIHLTKIVGVFANQL